ncbi:MAG: hypothetical protein Q9162_005103 [Coniocarpon cinnabarinum]
MASASNPFGTGNAAISDDFDMNDFVNLDQDFHNSPSPTSVKMEPHQSLDHPDLVMQNSSHQARQHYNGPSHNYDQFRQQTGLPSGAISHVHAVNQFSNSSHVRPTSFGAAHFGGYNSGPGFPVDSQDSCDGSNFYLPGDTTDDFAVDPSAIAPDSQPTAAFRAWPGMHSQQAKQQAQAQEDTQKQRQDEALQSQQSLPTNFEQTLGGRSRSQTEASEQQANEQISRLLNQMRQNSNGSMNDDDDGKSNIGNMSAGHGRKAEEDMDEDERLLASEEGKKLSSKERRQLRNKVSARAFRLRRKEHITTLEGEVATKVNECNQLRITNRHLLEQNRQLTQLCKAMLGHPGFNTFMEDMSNDPSLLQAFPPQSQPSSTSNSQNTQPQQGPVKQEQASTASSAPQQQAQQSTQTQQQQQNDVQVGVTMIPETNLDFSMLNLGANHWNNYQQPQIYAVHELPTGPSAEEIMRKPLSGKEDDKTIIEPAKSILEASAKDLPTLDQTTSSTSTQGSSENVDDIKDDPRFALYIDQPTTSNGCEEKPELEAVLGRLEHSLCTKPDNYFSVHVRTQLHDDEDVRRVNRLFERVEPLLQRVGRATRHLDL